MIRLVWFLNAQLLKLFEGYKLPWTGNIGSCGLKRNQKFDVKLGGLFKTGAVQGVRHVGTAETPAGRGTHSHAPSRRCVGSPTWSSDPKRQPLLGTPLRSEPTRAASLRAWCVTPSLGGTTLSCSSKKGEKAYRHWVC
jgi:hypothetical protein